MSGVASAMTGLIQAVGVAALLIGLYFTFRNIQATEDNVGIARVTAERNFQTSQETIRISQENLRIAQQTAERTAETAQESIRISIEGQITERFTKAVEQLGNQDSVEIRLGGLYSLERIAKDSKKDHWPVMEVLTAYVREKARPGEDSTEKLSDAPPIEIQTAMTILARRVRTHEERGDELDLSGVYLRGVNLKSAHLERADFFAAVLQDGILHTAHLDGADFAQTNLENVNAIKAILSGAFLEGANLKGATFLKADLRGADLTAAKAMGTNLIEANLERAILVGANLSGASVDKANLRDADLRAANLKGVDLSLAEGLTLQQIQRAIIDENTQLPEYLQPAKEPEKGDGGG